MIKALLKCVVLLAATVLPICGCSQSKPAELRVLSYNIHHGEGMDGKLDLQRIADVIRQVEPDLVALQEVDRGVRRTNGVDQPAVLAELTGMQAVFERNIEYQGGDYGNAVLSRLPIDSYKNHYLPKSLPAEQRGMLEIHVTVAGEPLVFLATHFDYHPDDGERLASVAMVREFLTRYPDRPVILAGDLNARPDSPVIAAATEFLSDSWPSADNPGFTFRADKPDRRIDYVMHNRHPSLRVVESRVLDEPVASDHRPLLTVFEVTP